MKHSWTPGRVDTGESRPALYTIKEIDGNLYMFFEWISGDVTIRGQKPCYYVLKKTKK
jgi:bla regulator protein BlaR1